MRPPYSVMFVLSPSTRDSHPLLGLTWSTPMPKPTPKVNSKVDKNASGDGKSTANQKGGGKRETTADQMYQEVATQSADVMGPLLPLTGLPIGGRPAHPAIEDPPSGTKYVMVHGASMTIDVDVSSNRTDIPHVVDLLD